MKDFTPGYDNESMFGYPGGGARAGQNIHMSGTGQSRTISADDSIGQGAAVVTVVPLSSPFSIVNGAVLPGLVGGLMPTINGDPLDDTTETVPVTGDFVVYFTLNFSVSYTETYLSSYTLTSVTVNTGASVPSDTDDTKYLHFNTVTSGVPVASFFDTSIPVTLYDDGPSSTTVTYT